jgi:ABC-type histidine transport system ATPase subunit
MSDAQIVEEGAPAVVFHNPGHERTKRFLANVLSQ